MKKSDAELVADGKRGNEPAITELFNRHYPSSLRLARGILRSLEEAQDSVQSAYLSAFLHLDSFREDAAFKTWITRIVTNHCLMRLRQPDRRRTWVDVDEPDENGMPVDLASQALTPEKFTLCGEISSAISDAAAKLPLRLREAFTLYAIAGLSLKEIAATLGLTVSGAKTRLFRANARMRLHLEPVWSEVRILNAPARPKNCRTVAALCR